MQLKRYFAFLFVKRHDMYISSLDVRESDVYFKITSKTLKNNQYN